MRKYFDVVFLTTSIPAVGAKVFVTDAQGNLATLYSDNGVTTTPNPVTTDKSGMYSFYVADGNYTLTYQINSYTLRTITDVQIYDEQASSGAIGQIENGTSPSAGTLTGTEIVPVSRGSGLLQTTITMIGQWVTQTYLAFKQAGTGSIYRAIVSKLFDYPVTPQDFGAKGDGVTDDTAAFTAFLTYLKTNGGKGSIPGSPNPYLISYIDINLAGNKPFEIVGDGIGKTVLKCTAPTFNFLTFSNCSKVAVRRLTIDNNFQVGQSQANGGSLIFAYANDCTVEDVAAINVVRVAFMTYNDHQTTLTNVYSGMVYNRCYVDGGAAYVEGVSPSAYILADVNNSRIENGYIKNIGLYGYEFKNDCSGCFILNSEAENVYNPVYFGGDGAHTELGYVKNSLVANILINGGTNPLFLGNASNNTIHNVRINNTGRAGQLYTVGVRSNSNYNSITGIEVIGRGTAFLFDLRTTANDNLIEFSNIVDAGSTQTGGTFDNTTAGNRVIFGIRDSTQNLIPTTIYGNSAIDLSLNTEQLSITGSAIKKIKLGDVGNDSIFSTGKGVGFVGNTMDVFWQTNQDLQFQYVGNFTKPDIFLTRYQLSNGERREYETVSGTTTFKVSSPTAFYPGADLGKSLGLSGFRWSNVFAQNVTLSPQASVTPASNGQMTFQLTSNTQLTIKVKGSDGVVRTNTLTLA
jgi:hypothetical protein